MTARLPISFPPDLETPMTDVNDLHEGDDRGPDEPEQESPLDLGEVEAAHEQALIELGESWAVGEENTELVLRHMLPKALAELREARQRIAEWEALEKREEWTVTGGPNFPAEPSGPPISPDKGVIAYVGRHATAQLWRRMLSVHPWEPIESEAPF